MASADITTGSIKCRGVGTFEPSPRQKVLFEQIAMALPTMPSHKALAERFGVSETVVECAISWATGQAIARE